MSASNSDRARSGVASKPGRVPQRASSRKPERIRPAERAWAGRSWTPELRAAFLRVLQDGAGVDAAVAAVGRTRASAFAERVRTPAFALAWDEAVACEEAMIEARLIERAIAGLARPADPAAARDAERVAMWILSGRSVERTAGTRKRGEQAGPQAAPAARTVDPALDHARADALLAEVAARIAAEEERLPNA